MPRTRLNDDAKSRLLACATDVELVALAGELGVTTASLKRQRTALIKNGWIDGNTCRFGLISRIDFPAEGFRRGLLDLAARDLARSDVQFVVLAGGLVDGRGIRTKGMELRRRIAQARRLLSALVDRNGEFIGDDDEYDESQRLQSEIVRFQGYLDEMLPENLAARLAELVPVFHNRAGKVIKLYVFPSPVYDREVGEDAARLLADLRSDDIRVYRSGGDRLQISQTDGIIEVLVPTKAAWRSKYYSTPVQRLLEDRMNRSHEALPDLFVIGGFGSTLTKPQGEAVRPYVSAPALSVLGDNIVNENQVGARVITLVRGHRDPVTLNLSYKDRIMNEQLSIKLPRNMPALRRRVVQVIIDNGDPMTVGQLADTTGIDRETLETELAALQNKSDRRPASWPGLRYHGGSKRWGLDRYWLREHLTYPDLPDNTVVDSIVAIGCPHTGSVYTDIPFQLEYVTKALLENDADALALVGDLIEGLKHGLAVKGEVIGGMNNTAQEELAGRIYAKITLKVAIARMEKLLAARRSESRTKINADELRELLLKAIVQVLIIAGNHDEWVLEMGFTPLVKLKEVWAREVFRGLCGYLNGKHLFVEDLYELVESKIVEPVDGKAILPSGLRVDLLHPHMGRAATHSGKPQ